MTLKSCLQKLTNKLKPEAIKIYYIGWKYCTYGKSEGLFSQEGESKEDFCNKVYQTTKKRFCGLVALRLLLECLSQIKFFDYFICLLILILYNEWESLPMLFLKFKYLSLHSFFK